MRKHHVQISGLKTDVTSAETKFVDHVVDLSS